MNRCGQRTEVYSRVVGYYRPVQQWNKGKRAEFDERVDYDLKTASRLLTTEETQDDGKEDHGQEQADADASLRAIDKKDP